MKKDVPLYLYNTLTRKKEIFKPIKKGRVGLYSCGPTVWNYAHIGNFRTYIFNDLLKRTLLYNGYSVNHVMNITDVDDRIIEVSNKEGVSFKTFTSKYEKLFLDELNSLHILAPSSTPRASEAIKDMVALIKKLLANGCAYKTEDGIYFSISSFKKYGALAGLSKIKKTKNRVSSDKYDKDNARDFALWKFYTPEDGEVFWQTDIGKGRPGWHIECSAMAMRALGKTIDIHTGAVDLIFPHHTNEVAQSECATGKPFVRCWMHAGFLNMKEEKMSKSLGNILTLKQLLDKGYRPEHYRYLCLQTHYRKPLDFSLGALDAARNAFERLVTYYLSFRANNVPSHNHNDALLNYISRFREAINDDLNIPIALSVLWNVVNDPGLSHYERANLIEHFDRVLGLGLDSFARDYVEVPAHVKNLLNERDAARAKKDWKLADTLRETIRQLGYELDDTSSGSVVKKLR